MNYELFEHKINKTGALPAQNTNTFPITVFFFCVSVSVSFGSRGVGRSHIFISTQCLFSILFIPDYNHWRFNWLDLEHWLWMRCLVFFPADSIVHFWLHIRFTLRLFVSHATIISTLNRCSYIAFAFFCRCCSPILFTVSVQTKAIHSVWTCV